MPADEGSEMGIGSLDDLKRVRDAEIDAETKLRSAKSAAEARRQREAEDAEGRIGLARTASRQEREERLRSARAETDREAAAIVAAGERAAEEARRGEGKSPAEHRDAILKAVLEEFRAG